MRRLAYYCQKNRGVNFRPVKGANTMDFKDNAMFQQMEKDTNVKINWQYAGDADWSEQRSRSCWPAVICPTYSSETML